MKVDDSHTRGNAPAHKPDPTGVARDNDRTRPPAAKASIADRAHLSPRAREYHQARQALAALPDEAPEKVKAVRDRINNGRYRIEADKIAAKMIREALTNDD